MSKRDIRRARDAAKDTLSRVHLRSGRREERWSRGVRGSGRRLRLKVRRDLGLGGSLVPQEPLGLTACSRPDRFSRSYFLFLLAKRFGDSYPSALPVKCRGGPR